MKTFDEMEFHPESEKLVQIICNKVSNSNPLFFRVLVAYYMCVVASMMRCSIYDKARGVVPVNMFALNLSTSGSGKNYSSVIMEHRVLNQFRKRFMDETMPLAVEENLPKIAVQRAARNGTDPDAELMLLRKEHKKSGPFLFNFDSGSSPAVKQMRHKLLLAEAGSACLQMDEIGATLIGQTEILTTFLELYDMGFTKTKLVKNTNDNERNEEIQGTTPTNMLLFGGPGALLNGGSVEEGFFSMLEQGYARRCFFGYSQVTKRYNGKSVSQVYDDLTDPEADRFMDKVSDHLETMADYVNMGRTLTMSRATSELLIEYKQRCEQEADDYPQYEEIRKMEVSHRYFKALKLAGAYAFFEDSHELTEDHLYQAIKLAEETGAAFQRLLKRDKSWVKLAKYIATCKKDVTQADMAEDLQYYKGAVQAKEEMLRNAIAWGYKNNIIIKKTFDDGIEFYRGEMLTPTDTDRMILAHVSVAESYHGDLGYQNDIARFDQLHMLTQLPDYHWIAHHLTDGHRIEENCTPGFNLAVVDIDGGVDIATAQLLLEKYQYLIYTTKRHTDADHRFRLILPINYELQLDAKDYKEFMRHVFDWLPFKVQDDKTNQRGKKWFTHPGQYFYNPNPEAVLLDALPFIPKTSKNEGFKQKVNSQASMDRLERWFVDHIIDGNRNSMFHRYAMMMVQAGFGSQAVHERVMALNAKIQDPLSEMELLTSVMVTANKAIAARA